jgi:hypothetical protein
MPTFLVAQSENYSKITSNKLNLYNCKINMRNKIRKEGEMNVEIKKINKPIQRQGKKKCYKLVLLSNIEV